MSVQISGHILANIFIFVKMFFNSFAFLFNNINRGAKALADSSRALEAFGLKGCLRSLHPPDYQDRRRATPN